MQTARPLILVAAVVLLVVGLAGAGATLQGQPTAVAVVNMERVFDSLREKTEIEAQMRARAERLNREQEQRHRNIQQLRQDLEVLAPGSEAYTQKEAEMREAVMAFRLWTELEHQQLEIDRGLHLEGLYRRTLEGIRETASERGYDLVLYKESPLQLQGGDPAEVQQQIALRKVLYANDSIDITDDVVQRMNNQHEARQ